MTIRLYTDEYFMKKALELAHRAFEEDEIPIGAVVVCENKIIGKGFNQVETLNDVSAHAEMIAISAACQHLGAKYLQDCTIYVTLEPCPMCAHLIAMAQIKQLVYAAPDPKKGYSLYSPLLLHPKTLVKSGILMEESSNLLKNFFKKKR